MEPLLSGLGIELLGPDDRERATIRVESVESFAAVVQMARAGFGNGLVPLGLARDLGLARAGYAMVPGVTRRIALFARNGILGIIEAAAHRLRPPRAAS